LAEVQAAHPEQRIELWFQDEARFGQHGCNSRCWATRGSRPSAVRQTDYEWLYLFSAVCPASGRSNAWIMPLANTVTMQFHLDSLSRSLAPDVHALLVLDGAGWHGATALRVPSNLTLLKLPPYAPELNPAEALWRELRQRYLSNRLYPDLDALDAALAMAWLRLSDDAQRLRRLTNFSWINALVAQQRSNTDTS
jgi:transposase